MKVPVGIPLLAAGFRTLAAKGEKTAPEADAREILLGLHHEQDGDSARPVGEEFVPEKINRMADDLPQRFEDARGDALHTLDQRRGQYADEGGTFRVADGFDARHLVRAENGGD